jgi:hypothetical protein
MRKRTEMHRFPQKCIEVQATQKDNRSSLKSLYYSLYCVFLICNGELLQRYAPVTGTYDDTVFEVNYFANSEDI